MIFDLNNPVDRREYKEYCNTLYKWGLEKGGVVEIKKRNPPRSMPQNAYAHCIMSYFASEIGLTLEEVKYDYFKKTVNPDIFVSKRNHKGKEVTFVRSFTSLDSAELSLAITRFKHWSSKEAGIVLPDAENYRAMIEAEKQIAKYAEFL